MSFLPLTQANNVNNSLIGVGAQIKILDEDNLLTTDLYGRRIHAPIKDNNQQHLLLVIILSAVLFVTIVATYDVIKASLNLGFSNLSLNDPRSLNTDEDIERTLTADMYAFYSILTFFGIALLIAIITIPILLCYIHDAADKN